MKLTIVGYSGSFPGPESPASCYLVEQGGYTIALDMGSGSLGVLQRLTDMYQLDGILLSHLHLDHCADLCAYFVARYFRPGGSEGKVVVHGPQGVADRMNEIFDGGRGSGMGDEFTFGGFHGSPIEIGPFRITTTRMRHVIDSFALRVEADGKSLVYSGDTGPCAELAVASAGADLGLFEASFLDGDNPPNLHLSGADAARAAGAAGLGRLVLTHLVPWNDPGRVLQEAAGAWDGDISLASAIDTIEI